VTGYTQLAPYDRVPGWIRVSIGAPDENRLIRAALADVLGGDAS